MNSYDLILRRGRTVDGQLLDIAVQAGKIALVGTVPSTASAQVEHDLQGKVYVSAGWIDLHVH
ncbi:MAG: amidohydrolase/deacetylase family metallohydrolase, partial [Plesiomonas sp.]